MVDRLEMAKQYVQEMLEKRDDIVGAFVVGSVARGDATEESDIDLGLLVQGTLSDGYQRGGIDIWREGVYIEATLEPAERYSDVDTVLGYPIAATHMNDALILYDPTGAFTRVQKEVRAAFMEPKWLAVRVNARLKTLCTSIEALLQAVEAGEMLAAWSYGLGILNSLPSIPLYTQGITPSSTRSMIQLREAAPALWRRICEWEGSAGLTPEGVLARFPITLDFLALYETMGSELWGDVPRYVVNKAEWLARNGEHEAAVHIMWCVVSGVSAMAYPSDDPAIVAEGEELVHRWLHAVGWEGQEVLEEKVRTAEEMVAEMEQLAAHLPMAEG